MLQMNMQLIVSKNAFCEKVIFREQQQQRSSEIVTSVN